MMKQQGLHWPTKIYSFFLSYFFSFFIIFAALSSAQTIEKPKETARDTAARLQANYDLISSLQFDFSQSVSGQMSSRSKKGSGNAFFVKVPKETDQADKKPAPGKMRWNYLSPDKQVLLSDGNSFSMYFERLEQMIISPADSMQSDLTYSFFTGQGNLLDDFVILPPDDTLQAPLISKNKLAVIKLIPKKSQSQVASIHLWITADSLIQRIEILDHFDTRTILNLSHIETNSLPVDDPEAIDLLFSFTPPEGTEIIHQ